MSVTVTPYFTPNSIAGCRLWLDGADPAGNGVIPANASSLSTWVDKSGNGFNATANGTAATYNTNAVVFAGAQNYGTTLSSTMLTQSAFAVISYTGSAYMDIISVNSTSGSAGLQQIITGGTQRITSIGGALVGTGSAVPASTVVLYNYTFNSGASTFIYLNGTQTGTSTGSSISGSGTISIGSYNNSGGLEAFTGNMYELILFNVVLTTTQRQQVESYLAQKWNFTSSLPADHPGRNAILYRSSVPAPVKVTPYTSVTYAFAPTQISNCQLWLDSYDPLGTGSAPSYGATFTTLADKSGNARNFSVYSGNTYYCNYESRPSIFISNSIMYASNAVDLRNYTFFIVCQSSNYVDNQTTFVAMTGAAGCNDYNSLDAFGFYVDAVTNRNRFYASINTNVVYNYFTPVGANYYPLSLTCFTSTSAGSALSYANGNTGGSQNSSITRTGTATGFAIGCDYLNDSTKFYTTNPKVFINEIIVYNFVLSDTQRRQVEAYLTQKWALSASLPSGHTGLTVPYYVSQSIVSRAALTNPVPTVKTTGSATGGTITTANGYRTHSFTSVGSINFVITGSLKLQVLIVGGGGGGGFTNCAGGGGAGGAVATILVIPTGTYSVTVGAGGTGGNYTASVLTQAANGNDSSFYGITGIGGGYGGWVGSPRSGASGGCGGGGSYAGGVGSGGAGSQGGNGGRGSTQPGENNSGGGGGGMGGDGGLPNLVGGFSGGAGGLGATYVIGGTSYTVSGGGGGGTDATAGTGGSGSGGGGGCPSVSSGAAGNGTANTGSGGGGGGGGFADTRGGNGGSGIVVISYVYP